MFRRCLVGSVSPSSLALPSLFSPLRFEELVNTKRPAELERALMLIETRPHRSYESLCGWIEAVGAAEGPWAVTELLRNAGDLLDLCDEESSTSLWIAAWKGNEEVIRFLLRAGADVDKATDDGCTPLLIAAEEGH